MSIPEKIRAYFGEIGVHHRYRSWEHCYAYFRPREGVLLDRDKAALHLAFYLASWGMYRGSSFLLQHAYTIHLGAVDVLTHPRFNTLWKFEFGATDADETLVPTILDALTSLKTLYRPFVQQIDSTQPTDTLLTKIMLGTFGCLPACDRYFIDGFKSERQPYSYVNEKFLWRILKFAHENLGCLKCEQERIKCEGGSHYPLMKLVDMYFWRIGYERDTNSTTFLTSPVQSRVPSSPPNT
jgi:hypothetical protein